MIWFLERNTDLLICEIRRSLDGTQYQFETAPGDRPPQTESYESASELIERYLREQTSLRAQGWRPRSSISTGEDNQ